MTFLLKSITRMFDAATYSFVASVLVLIMVYFELSIKKPLIVLSVFQVVNFLLKIRYSDITSGFSTISSGKSSAFITSVKYSLMA